MAAIAPCFRLRLPSCGPRFESQAHHLRFFQFVLKLWREKNENKQKEAGIRLIFKKPNTVSVSIVGYKAMYIFIDDAYATNKYVMNERMLLRWWKLVSQSIIVFNYLSECWSDNLAAWDFIFWGKLISGAIADNNKTPTTTMLWANWSRKRAHRCFGKWEKREKLFRHIRLNLPLNRNNVNFNLFGLMRAAYSISSVTKC